MKTSKVLMVSLAFVLFVVFLMLSQYDLSQALLSVLMSSCYNSSEVILPRDAVTPPLDFVPAAPAILTDCDQLSGPNTAAASFNLSSDHQAGFPAFSAAVSNAHALGPEWAEGYAFQMPSQYKLLHYLAGRPNVSRICETGFNLGHSSFNFLTANRNIVVHSFDLGDHKYAHGMAACMQDQFPSRFFVHFGDSRQTVPKFALEHPNHRCDFIHVDGGHTYEVALADLLNLAAMADVGNMILFDDYPSWMFQGSLGCAWENVRRWGYVRELLRCTYKRWWHLRGFVLGTVIRPPSLADIQQRIR